MIIKKYQAKTETEAGENARRELGSGVVVMNVKQVKKKGFLGLFASPQVEVTVALEEERNAGTGAVNRPASTPTMTALEPLAQKQKEINAQREAEAAQAVKKPGPEDLVDNVPVRSITRPAQNPDIIPEERASEGLVKEANTALEEKLDSIETLIKKKLETDDESNKSEDQSEKPEEDNETVKLTKLLYNMMIDNEVYEKYANQIIEDAEKSNKPNMPVDYFLTNVYQKMILKFGQPNLISPLKEGPRVVYFVGPTGVGKTTTIAKLTSKLCLEEKKKVALLTSDTYRIAAAEQLRTYANILEIPCRIIYSPAEIEEAYSDFADYDYILVDTAGHSHHNEEQKNNTNVVLHALDGKTEILVYLVLSATTKYRDLVSIADTYKEMTDYRIIFTKLDETDSYGNLLNLKLYTGADLSYVTTGQNVPEDIDKLDPQAIVKKILGG